MRKLVNVPIPTLLLAMRRRQSASTCHGPVGRTSSKRCAVPLGSAHRHDAPYTRQRGAVQHASRGSGRRNKQRQSGRRGPGDVIVSAPPFFGREVAPPAMSRPAPLVASSISIRCMRLCDGRQAAPPKKVPNETPPEPLTHQPPIMAPAQPLTFTAGEDPLTKYVCAGLRGLGFSPALLLPCPSPALPLPSHPRILPAAG